MFRDQKIAKISFAAFQGKEILYVWKFNATFINLFIIRFVLSYILKW